MQVQPSGTAARTIREIRQRTRVAGALPDENGLSPLVPRYHNTKNSK